MTGKNRGWIVAFAGLGVNLVLGVLYAWSVKSSALIDHLGWSATMTQIPYMVACVVFASSMIPGGYLQDRYGPRKVLILSAFLAGTGFVLSGLFLNVWGLTVFYGIVFGLAMGMGYAAPTPAAVKWFDASRRGLISGIVVSGFGLAPVYIAPLTDALISRFGIAPAFWGLGVGFFTVIMLLTLLIRNPPAGHMPSGSSPAVRSEETEMTGRETLRTPAFRRLWVMFCFGTFAGLLLIGQLSKIGREQAGMTRPFLLIAVYALFNFLGRITCGFLSDRMGRMRTLFLMFLMQVAVYSSFVWLRTPGALAAGIAVVGFTFGGMLTIFPATTADYFGLRHFGVNYGLLITAWGAGGLFGPLLGGVVRDLTGQYTLSYLLSAIISACGAVLTFFTKPPARTT